MMHDIGALISFARHHRHSYYLIKNGDLRGFHPDEIETIALVARYHRRGTPRRSHAEYAHLPAALRRTVRALASILRLAESLDRSHGQAVSGLELRDRGKDLLLHVHTSGDAELEAWAANRHLKPFARMVGKTVKLEVLMKGALDGSGARAGSQGERRRRPRRSGREAAAATDPTSQRYTKLTAQKPVRNSRPVS
jgi:exopolyphosphatase/guanosine-5'-triphosphate,3'-diphosphate pyrophosphatase